MSEMMHDMGQMMESGKMRPEQMSDMSKMMGDMSAMMSRYRSAWAECKRPSNPVLNWRSEMTPRAIYPRKDFHCNCSVGGASA